MARRKNTRRFDPRYFMDEKTEKPITEARMSPDQEMKIGYADGYFYDTPGYGYDKDLARRSESYREGYRDGQEQRERDEVLDKDDAEDERLSALDDYYAEDDFYRDELDESANDMGPLGTMTRPSQVFRGTDDAVYDSALAYKKAGIAAPAPRTYATNNGYIAAVDDQGNVYVYVPGSEQHQKSRRYKFMDVIDMLKSEGFKEARFYVPGSAR
jgi:hypothetical protein